MASQTLKWMNIILAHWSVSRVDIRAISELERFIYMFKYISTQSLTNARPFRRHMELLLRRIM
jgi:hypothetical protein